VDVSARHRRFDRHTPAHGLEVQLSQHPFEALTVDDSTKLLSHMMSEFDLSRPDALQEIYRCGSEEFSLHLDAALNGYI
jgi:hypothetical protein